MGVETRKRPTITLQSSIGPDEGDRRHADEMSDRGKQNDAGLLHLKRCYLRILQRIAEQRFRDLALSDGAKNGLQLRPVGGFLPGSGTARTWMNTDLLNVTVNDGVVDLWGIASSDAERKAIRVATETTPGVSAVNDNIKACPVGIGAL